METQEVTGYWEDEPQRIFTVCVSCGTWDGIEDAKDAAIFYYMDGEPLMVGDIISESFIVRSIEAKGE